MAVLFNFCICCFSFLFVGTCTFHSRLFIAACWCHLLVYFFTVSHHLLVFMIAICRPFLPFFAILCHSQAFVVVICRCLLSFPSAGYPILTRLLPTSSFSKVFLTCLHFLPRQFATASFHSLITK